MPSHTSTTPVPLPWWRYGYVWLVISGPLAVVVAALVSGWIAVRQQDPVLAQDYYRQGLEINKTLAAQGPLAPAEQGRNHAASPPGSVRTK
ncbi:MAG: FixH family protein [Burkholderiales bacterium]|jgi:hypothetical protein|nr:FixH family protein [Burkholderiales bacterium]